MAPVDGYQEKIELQIPVNIDWKTRTVYLVLRTAQPVTYAFIKLEIPPRADDEFNPSCESILNPFGDRNLEPAVELPYAVSKKLLDDSLAAILDGKNPERPANLPEWVKEEKTKYEAETKALMEEALREQNAKP